MAEFDVGTVYSENSPKSGKTFYMAISKKTLVTFFNGRFGQFTSKKSNHVNEHNMTVAELCEHWNVPLRDFDKYMSQHFQPDDSAKKRARKEREELELQLQDEETNL